jgi:hypothetical protein
MDDEEEDGEREGEGEGEGEGQIERGARLCLVAIAWKGGRVEGWKERIKVHWQLERP